MKSKEEKRFNACRRAILNPKKQTGFLRFHFQETFARLSATSQNFLNQLKKEMENQ